MSKPSAKPGPSSTPSPRPNSRGVQLPELSHDIWRLIASTLGIKDLTNLAQSCKQFHRAIVSEEVFAYFCLKRYGNVTPPPSVIQHISWANLYRRSCAIRHAPFPLRNIPPFSSRARILATVANSIVLFFPDERKIRGFPADWERDVAELCDDPDELMACCVQLPPLSLGFVQSKAGGTAFSDHEFWSSFKTIHVVSGELVSDITIPVGRRGLSHPRMEYCNFHPKAIFLAGANGQYLAYFVDGNDVLRVIDRLTGQEVSNYSVVDSEFGRLLRKSFTETGGFSVVGIVYVNDVISVLGKRKCDLLLFDNDPDAMREFLIEDGEELIDVVKGQMPKVLAYRVTKDRKTLTVWRVEVSSQQEQLQDEDVLVDMERRWPTRVAAADDGSLVMATEDFSISPTGRQVLIAPKGIRSKAGVDLARRVFRATFDRDGSMSSAESVLQGDRSPETGWSWTEICLDNRMIVVCAQSAGLVALFDLEEGERLWSAECVEPLWDMALVGEHYLVGVGANSGKVYGWHFNAFCAKPQGSSCDETWAVGKCEQLFSKEEEVETAPLPEDPKEKNDASVSNKPEGEGEVQSQPEL